MRKMLSLVTLTALSVLLAYGVTLAAGGDSAYGVGTITVFEDPNQGNNIEILSYVGEEPATTIWAKEAAWLGDIMMSTSQNKSTQIVRVRNNDYIRCETKLAPDCLNANSVPYKLMIISYEGDPTPDQQMVYVTVTNRQNQEMLYHGPLSQLDSLKFDVGHTYVNELQEVLQQDISEIEITYEYWESVPPNTHLEYEIRVQELPL